MNIVWGTASTGGYGGTVFPGGVRYSLVNNVCEVRYSLGYRIHSDTGVTADPRVHTRPLAVNSCGPDMDIIRSL